MLLTSDFKTFDELNKAVGYTRSEAISTYFENMVLTGREKEYREDFARRFEDLLIYIFSLYLAVYIQPSSIQIIDVTEEMKVGYKRVLRDFYKDNPDITPPDFDFENDSYIMNHIEEYAADLTLSMIKHADDAYYYSGDRARFNGEEESLVINNYTDFLNAAQKYSYKTWRTMRDPRVRKTHVPLEGVTLPINDLFIVGNSYMRFPKDTEMSNDPADWINCRCWLTFS